MEKIERKKHLEYRRKKIEKREKRKKKHEKLLKKRRKKEKKKTRKMLEQLPTSVEASHSKHQRIRHGSEGGSALHAVN